MPQKTKHPFSLFNSLQQAKSTFNEFPRQFWIMVAAAFIDRLGGAMLFPFFTLYLTKKFGISMTQVGLIFGVFSISGLLGSLVGGALTDRLGRKGMLLFGLVMSALSALLMGVVNQIEWFIVVVLVVGILADSGGPAQQALVADLLPEEKRAQGFGILRVVFNLAITIGPLIGGLIATQSYLMLFIIDAITSLLTAALVYFTLHETWKPQETDQPQQTMAQTFGGYGKALKDTAFVGYLVASALMVMVYMQMNTTLAVYLRDTHGINERGFSYILSLNAGMVVLFQFAVTRRVTPYRPLIIMTVGTILYAIGFAMYGFFGAFSMFMLAMAIITIGEMMVAPVGQAIVARLAPEDMRGRYMAVFGFSWIIPAAVGPFLAGLVLDNLEPTWLWFAAGAIGIVAALGFYILDRLGDRARWAAVDQRLHILEQLEEGHISAEAARQKLEAVGEGPWVRLAPSGPTAERRHLRIRVSDLGTGIMKTDLRLPVALVNTVLFVGGQFSADLDSNESQRLKALLARGEYEENVAEVDESGKKVEIHIE